MSVSTIISIISSLIGGLGIFLLGMKNMSDGMQEFSGDRLRRFITLVTNNRFFACGIGVIITSIIQSSSITTVMVVGLVNTGLMTLSQAIGVIMGANIGTTITAWILVVRLTAWGLPMIGISVFFMLFTKNERIKSISRVLMGIGMIFFGLDLMAASFTPLKQSEIFINFFSIFRADDYFGVIKCILTGCIITLIIQSSSATVGITIGLAITGIISFETAVALVLGENVGTTITALLSSIQAGTNAKRAAYFHTIFNITGVIWVSSVFPFFLMLIRFILNKDPNIPVFAEGEETYPAIAAGIALSHSLFNIMNTIIFIPFTGIIANLLTKVIKQKPEKKAAPATKLNLNMLDTPAIAIEQSHKEIIIMAGINEKMLTSLRNIIFLNNTDEKLIKLVFEGEERLDIVQKEVIDFLSRLLTISTIHIIVDTARKQIRIADEYESTSDYIASLLKLFLKQKKALLTFTKEGKRDLAAIHEKISSFLKLINNSVIINNAGVLSQAKSEGDFITIAIKEARSQHLERVGKQDIDPLSGLIFTDMLNAYRRIKDHCINITETIAGEK